MQVNLLVDPTWGGELYGGAVLKADNSRFQSSRRYKKRVPALQISIGCCWCCFPVLLDHQVVEVVVVVVCCKQADSSGKITTATRTSSHTMPRKFLHLKAHGMGLVLASN